MSSITPLSPPPTRQDPINFADKADTTLTELVTMVNELNVVNSEIDTKYNAVINADIIAENLRGQWVTATAYALKDVYTDDGIAYIVVVSHTSTSITNDAANGKVKVWQGVLLSDLAAPTGSSLVMFDPLGAGSTSRTVEDKLRDGVSILDYYANGVSGARVDPTGVIDSTLGIQAAMDAHYLIRFPAGTYKVSSLNFNHDNCVLVGDGQKATYIVSTITNGAVFRNPLQATVTRFYCGIEGMQITAPGISATDASLIDWRSMQVGTLKKLWLFGNEAVALSGVKLGAITWTVTECTYNKFENLYIGGVKYGLQFLDGANSNSCTGIRVQPSAGSYAYHLAFGTAAGRISNNVFVKCDAEFPGNVSTGYALGLGSDGTYIAGARLEGLATGMEITVNAVNTRTDGNYYSSCTTKVSNASTSTIAIEDGTFKPNFAVDNGYDVASYSFTSKRSRLLHPNGGSEVWLNDAGAGLQYVIYGSTYAGGTLYGVGPSGSVLQSTGGPIALATNGNHPVFFGTNGLVRMTLNTDGTLSVFPAPTVSAPPYGKGKMYFDETLNKLRIGGAVDWETVTSV
jgi:hypothetical protein